MVYLNTSSGPQEFSRLPNGTVRLYLIGYKCNSSGTSCNCINGDSIVIQIFINEMTLLRLL